MYDRNCLELTHVQGGENKKEQNKQKNLTKETEGKKTTNRDDGVLRLLLRCLFNIYQCCLVLVFSVCDLPLLAAVLLALYGICQEISRCLLAIHGKINRDQTSLMKLSIEINELQETLHNSSNSKNNSSRPNMCFKLNCVLNGTLTKERVLFRSISLPLTKS